MSADVTELLLILAFMSFAVWGAWLAGRQAGFEAGFETGHKIGRAYQIYRHESARTGIPVEELIDRDAKYRDGRS